MAWKPKKDMEYVSKVEKAISDKFGEEATINPRSLWNDEKEKEYIEQAKQNAEKYYKTDEDGEMVESEGILISKKLLNKSNAKSCPTCNKYLADTKDSVYLLRWDCCFTCYIDFVEDREERWKKGWRPNKEDSDEQRKS